MVRTTRTIAKVSITEIPLTIIQVGILLYCPFSSGKFVLLWFVCLSLPQPPSSMRYIPPSVILYPYITRIWQHHNITTPPRGWI